MSVGFPKIPTMAKTINISYKGESAVFGYKPIDRGVLYGKRRRVPFDAEGNECAKASLLADGSTPELFPATVGETVEATLITATEALNLRFETTYALEAEELSEGIKKELDAGSILTFPFNPRADYHVETGILVSNENGYFALIGEKVEYEFASLAAIASVTDEAASDNSDDLDFEMF